MKSRTTRLLLAAIAMVSLARPLCAADRPTTRPATRRAVRPQTLSFDLRPEPPPTPALLFQLACDPAERRAGTGAADYLQAAVLLTDAEQTLVEQARDAEGAGDWAAFDRATTALFGDSRVSTILDLLDDASRRYSGGLDAAWRDAGIDAVLAELNPMRALSNLLYVRARQRTRAGDLAGAVATLRAGYALARAVGNGGPLVCGLVGIGGEAILDRALSDLMGRPDAPNLYWALATMPVPVISFRLSMEAERRLQAGGAPELVAIRTADAGPGDWLHMSEDMVAGFHRGANHAGATTTPSPMMAAVAKGYVAGHPEVTAYYARRHHSTPAEVANVDAQVVLGTYYLGRFQDASDELYKLLGQPYPVLIPRVENLQATLRKQGLVDGNLFAIAVPSFARSIEGFAQIDRTRAAFTAVEAIRSYAAAHGARLPDHLVDVTETPVPDNPVTGRPFEWRVGDGVGTLGDHDALLAARPLEYTVRIRPR
jgi:hypothetical protein